MLRPVETLRRQPPLVLGLGLAGTLVLALLAIYLVLTLVLGSLTRSPAPASGAEQQLAASQESEGDQSFAAGAPKDTTLSLTVPKMARAEGVPVETGEATDTEALKHGALRVAGTGFPWQSGANTYIAGHRLGFPSTRSYLLFYDLNKLANGDRIFLEDARGAVYEYAVFHKEIVGPRAVRVTAPVAGKSVVTLQSCTLPNYSERLVVQAELQRRTEDDGR